MTMLIIGPAEKEVLQKLRAYAEKHPRSMDDMLDIMNGGVAPGDIPEHVCVIPMGFKVCFTIEPGTTGQMLRHVSISSLRKDRLPLPEACQMIMDELGFVHKVGSPECKTYIEEKIAINLAELI